MKKLILHDADDWNDSVLLLRAALSVRRSYPDEVEGRHVVSFSTTQKIEVWSTTHAVNAKLLDGE